MKEQREVSKELILSYTQYRAIRLYYVLNNNMLYFVSRQKLFYAVLKTATKNIVWPG